MIPIEDKLGNWDKLVVWAKSKLYTVLSMENLDKLSNRKEKELKDLELIRQLMHKKIRKELEDEFEDYYTEEEIDTMFKEIINE
jgi:hypothetical protein